MPIARKDDLSNLMHVLAAIVVVGFALFLIGLAITIFVRPNVAARFLNSFASSARAHFTEQFVRLIVGGALVVYAERMWNSRLYSVIGWLIVVPSLALLCIPWRWHHRFAQRVVPPLIPHMKLYAIVILGFSMLLMYGMLRGAGYF